MDRGGRGEKNQNSHASTNFRAPFPWQASKTFLILCSLWGKKEAASFWLKSPLAVVLAGRLSSFFFTCWLFNTLYSTISPQGLAKGRQSSHPLLAVCSHTNGSRSQTEISRILCWEDLHNSFYWSFNSNSVISYIFSAVRTKDNHYNKNVLI